MTYEYAPALIHAGKKNRDMKDVYPGEGRKNMGNAVRTHLLEQKIAEGCGQNFTAYNGYDVSVRERGRILCV